MEKFKRIMNKISFWIVCIIYCIAAVVIGSVKEVLIGIVYLIKNLIVGVGHQFGDAAEKSARDYEKKFKTEKLTKQTNK